MRVSEIRNPVPPLPGSKYMEKKHANRNRAFMPLLCCKLQTPADSLCLLSPALPSILSKTGTQRFLGPPGTSKQTICQYYLSTVLAAKALSQLSEFTQAFFSMLFMFCNVSLLSTVKRTYHYWRIALLSFLNISFYVWNHIHEQYTQHPFVI